MKILYPVHTRIREVARERGWTMAQISRTLHAYPSNLSLMDRGQRSVSLKALSRIARLLGTSTSDLISVSSRDEAHPFPNEALNKLLAQKDRIGGRGKDRSWLHATMLAWQRHFLKKEFSS